MAYADAAGAIKNDAGVQGLPCKRVCWQGKPCTPGITPSGYLTLMATSVDV